MLSNRTIGLIACGVIAGFSAAAMQGCDKDDICGPCGSIATGQLSISGDARLDGFFGAVANLRNATLKIKADFDADILALADVYGLARAEVNADFVAELIGEIKADFSANLEGGIQVVYKAPECRANVEVAVDAQAKCEASAKCDVMVDPGEVSVACEGSCSGSCSAECSGDFACAVEAPSVACSGKCEGACELDAAAECSGTCRGDCSGACSARDGEGKCAGKCDGMCTGTCELTAAASCQGTCSGKCLVQPGSAECSAEAECRGSCSGECKGSCTGKATPPSASADCEASADCQAQASAQASASLECTPPSLDLQFAFAGGVDASAQAAFMARIGQLKVRGAAIVQGAARLGALINGEVNGEVVFDPAPLAQVTGAIQGVISAGVSGEFDIPAGRIACVIPAFEEAVDALAAVAGDVGGTIQAQAMFTAFVTTGK